ncbi:hypothetical protein PHYSODRAFT_518188 [Phytophthora sojae]|uniref:Uncharacterized protein n=1 Tax=Phytophthora sojae (strain P6497) TaxID=1094619 RepID=G4ZY55_PHYSP|nr:hypothetical protein PHYSODRAFT_518188 [Phytophthora sojae]EGZ11961.1 hypothetical protein PHYSODRAFT_518188 [Phytophthora sojae]|eukprot:XP_009532294.1 hypothetical protein PHYSODRAFT_518188 [Phytophthora sojae]
MYRFPSRSLGVISPFRSEHITPPMRSMGECAPLSFCNCLPLLCLPSAQVWQLTRLWSVSATSELGSRASLSTGS